MPSSSFTTRSHAFLNQNLKTQRRRSGAGARLSNFRRRSVSLSPRYGYILTSGGCAQSPGLLLAYPGPDHQYLLPREIVAVLAHLLHKDLVGYKTPDMKQKSSAVLPSSSRLSSVPGSALDPVASLLAAASKLRVQNRRVRLTNRIFLVMHLKQIWASESRRGPRYVRLSGSLICPRNCPSRRSSRRLSSSAFEIDAYGSRTGLFL